MFDVFYFGPRPGLFEFERPADSLEHAAELSRTGYYWYIYGGNDYTEFDFTYRPLPWEAHYTHVWPDQHHIDGNVYLTKNPLADCHYHQQHPVHRLGDPSCFNVPENIDKTTVDFRWSPNPLDPPYIYHFPSQHQSASGVTYTVPGATEIKLSDDFQVLALPQPQRFGYNLAVAEFDYSWHPNPLDPPSDYIFGNQWNSAVKEPTVVYHMPGSKERKYMDQIARVAADRSQWNILDDITDFDYSWRPDPTSPPYRYVFGNQWLTPEQRPALEYIVPGAQDTKYMAEPRARRRARPELFTVHYDCEFDYSWEPDPGSPPYRYVFGNQWYPAEVMPTVEYCQAGATETKFVDTPQARLTERHDNHWHTLVDCEWDYSWRPEPGSPPMTYVFGNQHHQAARMPTVEYHMPGGERVHKYMDYPVAFLLPDRTNWTVPEEITETNIDFSWVPDPLEQPYIWHFGTIYQQSVGLTYTVPGAQELKFTGFIPKITTEQPIIAVLDIFFVDKNNATAQTRYEGLQARYNNVHKVRYANSMMDTIRRCARRSTTSKFWIVSSEYDYSNFDFAWHAEPWQGHMTHVFPSQHQKWSDTFLINRQEFERHSSWATGVEQFPNLNFVTNQTVVKPENLHNIYYVDHGNGEISRQQYEWLRRQIPDMVITRFVGNYLDTFKRIMATAETEWVWIINSICDYSTFDFTWQPEPWQKEMIHVFPSDHTRAGDTFYIHVESFKNQMYELDILDFFNVINYCEAQQVSRFSCPIHFYSGDNLIEEIRNYKFETPYVFFTKDHDRYGNDMPGIVPNFRMWNEKDRSVIRYSGSGSSVLVPRDIKQHLKTQIYDYPYIIKKHSGQTDQPLDIIYISNGEPDEQHWYDHVSQLVQRPGQPLRTVKWSRGVNGRTAAYQAAARLSSTPWFFMVFAKLEVAADFNFDWQPDYFQMPKHYIFNAHNPVNGLEYGHMGMIAYNKNLVLSNTDPGLDFTLSQPHESVPILSGTAHFNQDAWMTWRTAFREVLKLRHYMDVNPTVETEARLNTWLTMAQGQYARECLDGAQAAVEYFDSVSGDYQQLLLSYDWDWLRACYQRKHL